jgi:hypothetical protein
MKCSVKFRVFLPVFNKDGEPSATSMAIICEGEHSHPPPPPRKLPPTARQECIDAIKAFDLSEATARRIVASPLLPMLLNGDVNFGKKHAALINLDVLNYLIRKEKAKAFPWGTDFHGAQYLMQQDEFKGYIRKTELSSDGHFVVHLQSKEQSRLLMHSTEIHADKTFKRTKTREFEFNCYDPISKRIATIARVFTDPEDSASYYNAFKLVFDQAEKDMGYPVPFGHIVKSDDKSPSKTRVKAILLDEHGGQIKGLAHYFESKFPNDTGEMHVLRIVKTCLVHYERSIKKLETKGVNEGNIPSRYLLI